MMSKPTFGLKTQFNHLVTIKKHPRPWHLPVVIGLAVSLPVFIGAWLDNLAQGLLGSLGAMVILNLPPTGSLLFRWVSLLACGFAYVMGFTLGLFGHYQSWLMLPLMGGVGLMVSLVMGYYRLLPPAGLFMIMAMAIGLFMPTSLLQIPTLVGTVALGSLFSVLIGGIYALILLKNRPYVPAPTHGYREGLLRQSMMMAMGLMVALALLSWVSSGLAVAVAIFCLMFLVETLVVRHYGSAVVFITPLTVFLAEYSSGASVQAGVNYAVISARFWDTLLGCVIGFLMGWVCKQPRIEAVLIGFEQRVVHYWQHTYGQMEKVS